MPAFTFPVQRLRALAPRTQIRSQVVLRAYGRSRPPSGPTRTWAEVASWTTGEEAACGRTNPLALTSISYIIVLIIAVTDFDHTPTLRWNLEYVIMEDLMVHYVLLVTSLGARAPSAAA